MEGPEHQKFRQEFDDAVGAVDEHARDTERTLADLSIGADSETVGSGYRALNSSPDKVARSPEEKRRRDEYARTLREAIQRQIAANNEQIQANNIRLAELTGEASALERLLAALRRGEEADIDAQGRLRDAEAEAAIRAYERKYGVTIDRTDAGQIDLVLKDVLDEMEWIARDNERLERSNEALAREAARMDADPTYVPRFVENTMADGGAGVGGLMTAMFAAESNETRLQIIAVREYDEADRALTQDSVLAADDFFEAPMQAPPVRSEFAEAVKGPPTSDPEIPPERKVGIDPAP